jgi:phosphotransferase system enzyme I (PtsI)
MELDRGRILAIVTERGGAASHVAILARAFEIPAVSGIRDLDQRVPPGTVIGVNGTRGEVTLHPTARQQTALSRAALAYREERQLLQARSTERARGETESGIRVLLNIENFEELPPEVLRTTAGIGLYRTEFLFMGRDQFPTEEEQYDFYRSVLRRVGPREVTFRTIDVGADKPLKYLTTPREQNPVLGWRGIRLTFQWPDLLIPQLRALLRATAHGAVRVMLPMVTTV